MVTFLLALFGSIQTVPIKNFYSFEDNNTKINIYKFGSSRC